MDPPASLALLGLAPAALYGCKEKVSRSFIQSVAGSFPIVIVVIQQQEHASSKT